MNESRFVQQNKERSPPKVGWKHSWVVNQTQEALSKSPLANIPTEIIIRIFRLLSLNDLGNASLVCRSFKMIVDQDVIWQLKCKTSKRLLSKSFKEIYVDLTYEKYLRNQEQEKIRNVFRKTEQYSNRICCGDPFSYRYRLRPKNKIYYSSVAGFNQHPNASQEMTIQLSVDIDRTTEELISLLQKASAYQADLHQPAIAKQMITRYNRFMQLKASLADNILLVPTLDIEIVWQTHLLRPKIYRNDCLRLFHRVIHHSLLTDHIGQILKEQAFVNTCQLYEERFGDQYCPWPIRLQQRKTAPEYDRSRFDPTQDHTPTHFYSYWDQTLFKFASQLPDDYENPFSFREVDLSLDSNWLDLCKIFMLETFSTVNNNYHNAHPWRAFYSSPSTMKLSKKSYERFLYMTAKYPFLNGYNFSHSTYAIDFIWYSHMQEPLNYASDCFRLVGYVIDHVPWPSVERSQTTKLCENANDIWKMEFDCDMKTDHFYSTANQNVD